MDAAGSIASSSPSVALGRTGGSGPTEPEKPARIEPVEPKQEAAERRAETDREQGEERLAAARERSDAGPGVGRQIDITV